jgi:hypothetical protein
MFSTATIDGKHIAYTNDTVFLVEVGKGSKGSYKVHYRFVGDLRQAAFYYTSINVGNGYKKRLRMATSVSARPLARQFSY